MILILLAFGIVVTVGALEAQPRRAYPRELKPPVVEGIWVRPAPGGNAEPVIGFKDGIRIALWPINGPPRGLIRVHAPYVLPGSKHPNLNFIAVEPIVDGRRSYSELERSLLDDVQGKRLWFSNELSDSPVPSLPWNPSTGKLGRMKAGRKEIETLSIAVNIEKLENASARTETAR